MVSLVRVTTAVVFSTILWVLTRMVSGSPKVGFILALFLLTFGLLSTIRTYLIHRKYLRFDSFWQYVHPALASVIVAAIIRLTHF